MDITSLLKRIIRDKFFPSIKFHDEKITTLEKQCDKLKIKADYCEQHVSALTQKITHLEQYLQDFRNQVSLTDSKLVDFSNRIFHLIPQNELNILKKGWWYHGNNENLLALLQRDMISTYCWETYDTDYWLICLSVLIERGDFEKASELAELYVKYHGLNRVDNYLIVSEFFYTKGLKNKSIEKAKIVFDSLVSNANSKVIENYFRGKSVAIVGNGPSELGKEKGIEIDSHDVVIRFNNFKTDEFTLDYGKKTNIWIRGSGADDVNDRENIDIFDLVIWEADYNHFAIYYDHLDILYRDILKAPGKICNFDFDTHYELRKESKIDFPSTGLVAIWSAVKSAGVNNVNIYGFSALESESDYINTHYFNDRSLDESISRTGAHNMKHETMFIKQLFKIE